MSDVDLIKEKIDIIDLISEYVQLKPSGVNHKGLCPFHREKTPSFMVNRERQSFKCFGCNKGGDVFTFVQEIEGLEFVEALKNLASRAGVALTNRENDVNSSQKNRLRDINTESARFFHNFLIKMDLAAAGRAYVKERGIQDETMAIWQIGYAPDQWDLLTQYLLKKGYSINDLVASGLTIQREGAVEGSSRGFYDRFRGRIMFPICDVHGGVVGFMGRILVETPNAGGKYVNTPQTILYDKSRVVFGLDKAKQAIKASDRIVLVEGQMDVIAVSQGGMKEVVATSGTTLTEHQIQLLKRYSHNLSMAFDADTAGQAAAKRGIDIALEKGMNIRVIIIPPGAGKDPDECVKNNPDQWLKAVGDAQDIMYWYFDRVLTGKNLSDPKHKQEVVNTLLPEVLRIPYAVERDHWIQVLSEKVGVESAVLREDAQRILRNEKHAYRSNNSKSPQTTNSFSRPIIEETSRLDRLIEEFVLYLVRFPLVVRSFFPSVLASLDSVLSTSPFSSLYEAIKNQYTTNTFITFTELRETVQTDNDRETIENLLMKADLFFASEKEEKEIRQDVASLIRDIREEWKKKKRQEITSAIGEAEERGDRERVRVLMEDFQRVIGG